ncbi:short-chain dehydrogenase reductase 3b-like [Panicum miliaceum]|uniref:Short-chain dehydrogenase reductase 3b-like n=1 Tax=Panicum miliaceum TaxID=4540 RepID=A0A3L6TSV1_PANMI|nr:short-chain dehydrogenase reductase 3b-like [Panicum miliaceum]
MSKPRLDGKVAIVTGGASGIGEAAARLFASSGATVVIADIHDALGEAVAASAGCTYMRCDVTDEEQVEATVGAVVGAHGRLDVMLSNAGVLLPTGSVMDMDLAELDRVMAVNFRGAAACVKHAARAMVVPRNGARGGAIVCTASVASLQGGFGPASYTASKHALLGLVRAAAGELGRHGVRVNCVSPSGVATPMSCALMGVGPEELEAMTVLHNVLRGKVLRAEDVAEAALFLASEQAGFISGHNLVVDGATTAINPAVLHTVGL